LVEQADQRRASIDTFGGDRTAGAGGVPEYLVGVGIRARSFHDSSEVIEGEVGVVIPHVRGRSIGKKGGEEKEYPRQSL
jgi:hypothetical protein